MSPRPHIRDLGYGPGYYTPGSKNSILDIPGLQVGQKTIHDDEAGAHVGVTLIYPRGVEKTREKPSYAAIHTLNGGGEMTGSHFVKDWGFTASPIAFTDSLSLGAVYQALTTYSFALARSKGEDKQTEYARHTWPVVAETWGGGQTDIYDGKTTLKYDEVVEAIEDAKTRETVAEGNHGGGAAMMCMGHKGGTGTSSRLVPGVGADGAAKQYTVGVLVQSNYGTTAMLTIDGVPVGKLLLREEAETAKQEGQEVAATEKERVSEGSIVVCVVTDAPLLPHQLQKLAERACWGLTAVGGRGVGYTSSGDILIALSTSDECAPFAQALTKWSRPDVQTQAIAGGRPTVEDPSTFVSGSSFRRLVETQPVGTVVHTTIDALYVATAEATEEAVLNSLCQAEDLKACDGTIRPALDVARVKELLDRYRVK